MAAITYANLDNSDASVDNTGGFTQRAYYAAIGDFLSIKTPGSVTTLADKVKITTAHTFNSGKCFRKLYCTMDRGKFDLKSQGETDGVSFKQEAEIFFPGTEAEAHGFAAQAKNDRFIFLLEPINAATAGYLQVGTEALPAVIKPEFTAAQNASGVRGYTFKIEANTPMQYIYTGTITTTPAT